MKTLLRLSNPLSPPTLSLSHSADHPFRPVQEGRLRGRQLRGRHRGWRGWRALRGRRRRPPAALGGGWARITGRPSCRRPPGPRRVRRRRRARPLPGPLPPRAGLRGCQRRGWRRRRRRRRRLAADQVQPRARHPGRGRLARGLPSEHCGRAPAPGAAAREQGGNGRGGGANGHCCGLLALARGGRRRGGSGLFARPPRPGLGRACDRPPPRRSPRPPP